MKKYKLLFFSIFIGTICFAQQEPLTTMFWNNYSINNPAATGIYNTYYAASTSRIQWTNINGKPITQSVLFDYNLDKINSGIGLNYTFDQIGFEKSNKINFNYSYHLKLKKERALNAGLSFGYEKLILNYEEFVTISVNDPLIPLSANYNFFNIGVGFLFKMPHLLVGVSATQLNERKELFYNKSRHIYFCTIGNINLTKNIEIKPGIYFRAVDGKSLLESNIRFAFNKKYWAGVSYRIQNSICFMAGLDIKEKYRISYAYDHFTNNPINFGATHELGLVVMLR